jgi:hypothetical protein
MITPVMQPGKVYPVFFEHYGGPHSQVVTKGWTSPLAEASSPRATSISSWTIAARPIAASILKARSGTPWAASRSRTSAMAPIS